jgi:DNA-binding IclR family transcriptional regulator
MIDVSKLPDTNVIGRTLRVLDALTADFRVSLQDVCLRTGLSQSTAHRILANLVTANIVAKDGFAGEYRLTGTLQRLCRRVDDRVLLLDSIAAHARSMTLRRSWPLALGILDRDGMVVIFSTRKLTTRTLKPSTLYEKLNFLSAMGQAALASMSPAQTQQVLDALPDCQVGMASRTELEKKIRSARARGYGVRLTGRAGASSVAVGLNFGGPTVGAIVATVFETVASPELMKSLANDLKEIRGQAEKTYRGLVQSSDMSAAKTTSAKKR